jgi:hypothetical protein
MVDEALNVAQRLSSLSCMFVGARGLSYSIDKAAILEFMETCDTGNILIKDAIQINERHYSNPIHQSNVYPEESHLCSICLRIL